MRRLIILEGPDGSGKTTLADKLLSLAQRRGLSVDYRNHGPYLDATQIAGFYLASVESALHHQMVEDNAVTVMDRSWLSEPIYGRAVRGTAGRISHQDQVYLEAKSSCAAAVVVFCLPSAEVCLDAWRKRRDVEYVDDESQMRAVHRGYVAAFDNFFRLPKALYDWTKEPGAETLLKEVMP